MRQWLYVLTGRESVYVDIKVGSLDRMFPVDVNQCLKTFPADYKPTPISCGNIRCFILGFPNLVIAVDCKWKKTYYQI